MQQFNTPNPYPPILKHINNNKSDKQSLPGGSVTRQVALGQNTPIKNRVGEVLKNVALASTSSRSSDKDAIDDKFKTKTTMFSPTIINRMKNEDTPLRIPQ